MRARNLLFALIAALVPASAAQALQVKVSINFGPTLAGPDTDWCAGGRSFRSRFDGDPAAASAHRFDDVFRCTTFTGGPLCPGTPGSASLRIDAVPEPATLLLFGSGLMALGGFGRKLRP